MSCCPAFEPLLLERASGSLEDAAGARLDAHLGACQACRGEAAALVEVLALVRLPPVGDAERAALAGLADSVRLAQGQAARRTPWTLRRLAWPAAGAAAAAALLLAASPIATRRAAPGAAATPSTRPTASTWQAPDPDELLEAADLYDDGAEAAELGADELALAAATADDP
jgi:anti-sigma factor RsiW